MASPNPTLIPFISTRNSIRQNSIDENTEIMNCRDVFPKGQQKQTIYQKDNRSKLSTHLQVQNNNPCYCNLALTSCLHCGDRTMCCNGQGSPVIYPLRNGFPSDVGLLCNVVHCANFFAIRALNFDHMAGKNMEEGE